MPFLAVAEHAAIEDPHAPTLAVPSMTVHGTCASTGHTNATRSTVPSTAASAELRAQSRRSSVSLLTLEPSEDGRTQRLALAHTPGSYQDPPGSMRTFAREFRELEPDESTEDQASEPDQSEPIESTTNGNFGSHDRSEPSTTNGHQFTLPIRSHQFTNNNANVTANSNNSVSEPNPLNGYRIQISNIDPILSISTLIFDLQQMALPGTLLFATSLFNDPTGTTMIVTYGDEDTAVNAVSVITGCTLGGNRVVSVRYLGRSRWDVR